MSKKETELTVLEPVEIPSGELADETPRAQADGAAPANAQEPAGTAEAAGGEEQAPSSELDQLKAERDHLRDRVARLQAEFENARKRAEREKTEFREYAAGSVVEQFLPVIDNFDLALKSNGTEKQLRSGVALIVKQMEEALRQLQVTAVPAVGEAFDPRFHEAIGSVDRDDLPDQHVAEEVRRGYKLRDRLLRPAMVRVAHNSKQQSE